MIFPIARRELGAAARNPKLYRARVRFGIAELLGTAALLYFAFSRLGRASSGALFSFMAGIALLFCLLDGLRKAADSISEEKREGTLGLLFLSGVGGFEIVFGKFVSALVRSSNGLLAFFPVLAITLLMGGTTGGEFWRIVLVLLVTIIASTALCLFVSSITRDESVLWALGALAALCFLPMLAGKVLSFFGSGAATWVRNLSPFALASASTDSAITFSRAPFWIGILALLALSGLMLMLAGILSGRNWHPPDAASRGVFGSMLRGPSRVKRQRELLEQNPYFWLAFDQRSHSIYIAVLSGLVLLAMALLLTYSSSPERFTIGMVMLFTGWFLALTRTSLKASGSLIEARKSGLLELSLATLMGPRNIVQGQWAALRKTIFPVLLLAGTALGIFFISPVQKNIGALIWGTLFLGQALLSLFVVGWLGIWMALTCKTAGQAFFKTFVLGILIPNFLCMCGIGILLQAGLLIYARRKAWAALDELVQGFNGYTSHMPLMPLPGNGAPPVIR